MLTTDKTVDSTIKALTAAFVITQAQKSVEHRSYTVTIPNTFLTNCTR